MANMIPISTVTVGSGGSSAITFSNIPQTYTDLMLKVSARDNRSATDPGSWMYFKLNGSSSSMGNRILLGQGSGTPLSVSVTNQIGLSDSANATANTFSSVDVYIPNYTSSNYKPLSSDSVFENNGTRADQYFITAVWSNTSPITSITLEADPGQIFVQYSSATLYGIRKY